MDSSKELEEALEDIYISVIEAIVTLQNTTVKKVHMETEDFRSLAGAFCYLYEQIQAPPKEKMN